MFIDFEVLFLLGNKNPTLFTFKQHIEQKTPLYLYIKEVCFKNKVICFEKGPRLNTIKFANPLMSEITQRTALNLLRLRLAKEKGIEIFRDSLVIEAFTKLISKFNFVIKEGLDFFLERKIGKRALEDLSSLVTTPLEEVASGEFEQAIFLCKLMKFHETEKLEEFVGDCVDMDLFRKEVELLTKNALSRIRSMFSKKEEVCLFPEYGKEKWIKASADLRIGNNLFLFLNEEPQGEEFMKHSTLLKACSLIAVNEKKPQHSCFIYSWQEAQLFRLN